MIDHSQGCTATLLSSAKARPAKVPAGDTDGAWLGSIDISIKKARTARYFDMNTGDLGAASQPGGSLYNIEVSNGGLITFPGGIPLRDGNGEVVGAIGVSGSSVENDHTVADAGAKALG